MSSLSDILKEIETLPLGNVYIKKINNKKYYYHQYFLNGKRYSEILKNDKALEMIKLVKRRKELEKLANEYRKKERLGHLSKSADKLTGEVMLENTPVAKFENGVLIEINEKLAPLVIKRTRSLEKFLMLRVIDMSRTNARILKKILNIQIDEDYKTALYSYALSISDSYWFKPKHSKLKYHNVIFNNDIYFEAALKGDVTVYPHQAKLTPEITTTGSFEKGWKYIKGVWYLYKSGNDKQIFSELFCYKFAQLMGINTATYEYDNGYIRSPNFATNYNFEPMAALLDDNDKYEDVFFALLKIDRNIAKDYLKLIFFDSVVDNVDRHNENLGLLRNKKNGSIVSLAPNYDNNLALIANKDSLNKNVAKDKFVGIFIEFINKYKEAKDLFKEIQFKEIVFEDIANIINDIPIKVDNMEDLINSVLIRYKYLKDLFNKQHN